MTLMGCQNKVNREVVVKVKNTDLVKRHLDFDLLGKRVEVEA